MYLRHGGRVVTVAEIARGLHVIHFLRDIEKLLGLCSSCLYREQCRATDPLAAVHCVPKCSNS
jgi:hypothetical protein